MNENELENLRRSYLKILWIVIISAALLIALLILMYKSNLIFPQEKKDLIVFFAAAVIVSFVYLITYWISKRYENTAKQYLIKIALTQIPDLDINWETGGYSSSDDSISAEQQTYYDKFNSERKAFENELSKELKILKEKYFKKDKHAVDELRKKIKFLEKEQYEKDCRELENLKTASSNADEKVIKNYYKINYLKDKIKIYEERITISNFTAELNDLKEKSDTEILTESEKERITYLSKILEEHKKQNKNEISKAIENYQRIFMIENIVNTNSVLVLDDRFFGAYKGKKFIFIEAHDDTTRYHRAVFNGTILKIELNNIYDNKILLLNRINRGYGIWSGTVRQGLNKLKIKLPFYTGYEIYARSFDNVSSILNNDFINFVNTIKNDYSYVIENKDLYVIIPHQIDKYKFASLFKRVNDEKQYKSFYNDMNEILKIIEYAGKYAL